MPPVRRTRATGPASMASPFRVMPFGPIMRSPDDERRIAGPGQPRDPAPARVRGRWPVGTSRKITVSAARASGPPSDRGHPAGEVALRRGAGAAVLEHPDAVGLRRERDAGRRADQVEQPADRVAGVGTDDDRADDRAPHRGDVDQRPAVDADRLGREQRVEAAATSAVSSDDRGALTTRRSEPGDAGWPTCQLHLRRPGGRHDADDTSVPPVDAGRIVEVAPTASIRSRMLPRPPAAGTGGWVEADAVVAHDQAWRSRRWCRARPSILLAAACLTAFCTASTAAEVQSRLDRLRPAGRGRGRVTLTGMVLVLTDSSDAPPPRPPR